MKLLGALSLGLAFVAAAFAAPAPQDDGPDGPEQIEVPVGSDNFQFFPYSLTLTQTCNGMSGQFEAFGFKKTIQLTPNTDVYVGLGRGQDLTMTLDAPNCKAHTPLYSAQDMY
jgi:hypothetical protein